MSNRNGGILSWTLLGQRISLVIISAIVGGFVGVVMTLSMVYVSSKEFFLDSADKHGISGKTSSRFGGPLVCLGAIAFGFALIAIERKTLLLSLPEFMQYLKGYLLVALLAGGIGLWEDYAERLSPKFRLKLLFLTVGIYFISIAAELPRDVFPSEFPQFLNHPLSVGLGMTICVVGFINAGNVADGANGLLSTIAVVLFLVGYLETGSVLFNALLLSTFIFSLYNMFTGSIFLGDSGAYFLSALMAMTCVDLFMQGGSSVWFYACLLGYPCVELVRIMYVRWSLGQSLLSADNNHLHNLVFEKFKLMGFSSQVGNTCTGFSIASVSVAPPLIVYLMAAIPPDSAGWMLMFGFYCLVHLSFGRYLSS